MTVAYASGEHDEHDGHDEKSSHEKSGHDEAGHDESSHDENSHEEHGHDEGDHEGNHEAEHEKNGHDKIDHDEADHKDNGHDEAGHDESGHGEAGHEDEEQSVKLTAKQLEVAGIVVKAINPQSVATEISAPGEVMLNEYKTTSVTPRVSSQVVKRHVKLGDVITNGQPLVTLSSVDMATAQGNLLVTGREWQRVKKLGRKVVSAQRYTEARVAHEQAKARVLAFGMTAKQAESFLKSGDASKANGTFQLLATQAGTVIFDRFIVGELIEPGTKLFIISDESVLWVEAKLTPAQAALVAPGSPANIVAGGNLFFGKVVQVHHALDEETRTLGVRIEIANPDDVLHPGVFVLAQISSINLEQVLAVPVNAVLRSPDGDWAIFIEHEAGEFEPQEIELLRTVGDLAVIEGIDSGTRVVTQGAFFVQSELAKSGFEIHNH
ncbi:MAG: efflux transporter periplasmic adaptor subunit [Thiotrichaceae bacterium]|nr:MAG: efflux transporter periplasmic adaptor subunit [Thiotrichaceae bacterium]